MTYRDIGSNRTARSAGLSSGRASMRGPERLSKIDQLRLDKPAAKSAAHEGVVVRPMDKQISKILQMKRAQAKQHGSSVYRIREREEDDEQALYEEELRGTSAARMKTPLGNLPLVRLPPGVLKPKPRARQ